MTGRWHAYAPRRIRFLDVRSHAGWRLKTYSVSIAGPIVASSFAQGTELALAALPAPAHADGRAGAGLLILHHGRGMDYVVLGWWDRENELPLRVFVREQQAGAAWRAAQGAESVCVWDLDVIWQEREAWVQTVLAEGRPESVDAYLARHAFEVEATEPFRFDDLWDFDDPAGTERRFRELLPEVDAASDASVALQLRTQIARALSLQRRFDEAHSLLDSLATSLGDAAPIVRVRWLLERGRTLNSSGSPKEARPLFEEAWERAPDAGLDWLAVDAAHMVAIVAESDEALRWNETALDLARSSEDPRARKWRGSLLNNLGWTWHDRGDHLQALRLFEEALVVRYEEGTERQVDIARWCVARCLRSLGRLEDALAAQQALLADMEKAGRAHDGYVYEELGECTLALGRAEESRPSFAEAYRILSEDAWLAEQEPQRLERIKNLGGVTVEAK